MDLLIEYFSYLFGAVFLVLGYFFMNYIALFDELLLLKKQIDINGHITRDEAFFKRLNQNWFKIFSIFNTIPSEDSHYYKFPEFIEQVKSLRESQFILKIAILLEIVLSVSWLFIHNRYF